MSDRDEEEQGSRGFRVVDRRRFNSEGETREDSEAREEPAAPETPPRPTPPSGTAEPGPAADQPADAIDFISFAASLATSALGALGALPDGYGAGIQENPELAREYIEILGMLQQKTRGNLTSNEEQALQRLLTDLRMAYVEAGKAK